MDFFCVLRQVPEALTEDFFMCPELLRDTLSLGSLYRAPFKGI